MKIEQQTLRRAYALPITKEKQNHNELKNKPENQFQNEVTSHHKLQFHILGQTRIFRIEITNWS